MQINITGHHVEITDGLNQAVNKSLKKLISHYPDIENINVILTVEKHEQLAEGIVHFLGQDLVAKAKTDEMYKSIAELKGKLETLLQKRKATIKSHPHVKPESAESESEDEMEVELDD